MAVWTVDTWRVAPGREAHFLEHCAALSPDRLILYRDLDEEGLFWSPAKWENLEALEHWRGTEKYSSALRLLKENVLDHRTHIMTDVPGFLPDSPGRGEGAGRADPTE